MRVLSEKGKQDEDKNKDAALSTVHEVLQSIRSLGLVGGIEVLSDSDWKDVWIADPRLYSILRATQNYHKALETVVTEQYDPSYINI